MKTSSQAGPRWSTRAASAAPDYLAGSQQTTKDQSAAAIAAKGNYAAAITASIARGAFEKGLQRSGKAGWLAGIQQKGEQNFSTGVSTPRAQSAYVTNSGKFDSARNAAAGLARGPRGSAGNLQRVTAVANALHAAKVAS
jgi:hypothetical protein